MVTKIEIHDINGFTVQVENGNIKCIHKGHTMVYHHAVGMRGITQEDYDAIVDELIRRA